MGGPSGSAQQPFLEDDVEGLGHFQVDPLFYAHVVLMYVLRSPHMAFINGNKDAGIYSLVVGTGHLEKICQAQKLLTPAQVTTLAALTLKMQDQDFVKMASASNEKLEILLEAVFLKHRNKTDVYLGCPTCGPLKKRLKEMEEKLALLQPQPVSEKVVNLEPELPTETEAAEVAEVEKAMNEAPEPIVTSEELKDVPLD